MRFISKFIDFSYHLNENFEQKSYDHLCPWIVQTQFLLIHVYSEPCNSLLIITLFKVTEIRKRAVKEEKIAIEVPKREPHPAKGILCSD